VFTNDDHSEKLLKQPLQNTYFIPKV